MNVLWIVAGFAILGCLAKQVAWVFERRCQAELGFVSQQWLIEHRLSQLSHSQG